MPRAMRLCDICGGYDDFPRHVKSLQVASQDAVPTTEFLATLPDGCTATSIAELMDPTTYCRHMDCCATAGCDVCPSVLTAAGDVSGELLTAALATGVADHLSTPGD